MTTAIRRLLIANRGEIACRIMRTARELGIETVAVYSEPDRNSLHVRTADVSVLLGPEPNSYLSVEHLIDAAERSGADAIHPGYGFLSESPSLARGCAEANIIFVGPSEDAITLMGDKARAKRAMHQAGVPCVPGYHGQDQAIDLLTAEAAAIGYPIMVKAAAGGGGRGMRLVADEGALANAIAVASDEAASAFEASELILEKALRRPRHVEIQILGDSHGNIVHLGERDCSVQRRHQKVIEEAPCPILTPELRARMGETAVVAAKAVDYVGAGTVEFLLADTGEYYFLEMNTRLQVEHPVTELVTGRDLVHDQIRVAEGAPLDFDQSDLAITGHAIEVRLYAEDPHNNFLPSTGDIKLWLCPEVSGVRVDVGIDSLSEVSPHYDPLVAKVIAWGSNREEALRKLLLALSECAILGPQSNRDFLIGALNRDTFTDGRATTAFIAEEYESAEHGDSGYAPRPTIHDLQTAALIQQELRTLKAQSDSLGVSPELINWSSDGVLASHCEYEHDGDPLEFALSPHQDGTVLITCDGHADRLELLNLGHDRAAIRRGAEHYSVAFHDEGDGLTLSLSTATTQFSVRDNAGRSSASHTQGTGSILAPMHGLVVDVFVELGQAVQRGDRIAMLEAMKMQHEILADVDGTVDSLNASVNHQIALGEPIASITPAESE